MNRLRTGRHKDGTWTGTAWLLATQVIVVVLVLALTLGPARGAAAIVLPLPYTSDDADSIAWAQSRGATVLGTGPYVGSIVIRMPGDAPSAEAMAEGKLLLAIPEAWCGRPPNLLEIPGPHA